LLYIAHTHLCENFSNVCLLQHIFKMLSFSLENVCRFLFNAWVISYLKCSDWSRISKLLLNFGCLFTSCYFDRAKSIKTNLQTCNLYTVQFISYKSIKQFWLTLPYPNSKTWVNIQSSTTVSIFDSNQNTSNMRWSRHNSLI